MVDDACPKCELLQIEIERLKAKIEEWHDWYEEVAHAAWGYKHLNFDNKKEKDEKPAGTPGRQRRSNKPVEKDRRKNDKNEDGV